VTLPADAKEKMLPLSSSPPMIRSGERILVEEHTSVVDAQLEAIALRSAKRGEVLQVRLVLGGSILKARVSGPGSAELVTEARP
jgi:flagella basal body P-ring formation protein FlgA